MIYNHGKGEDTNWLVAEESFNINHTGKCEAIMCQGNGYIGIRAATEEDYLGNVRNTFISGTFNKFADEVTELPNTPDVIAMPFVINGEDLDLSKGTVKGYVRVLNLKNGLVSRNFIWTSPKGVEVEFKFRRVVSLQNKHIVSQEAVIKPLSGDISIQLPSGINGQFTNSGSQHFIEGEKRCYEKKFMQYCCQTLQSAIDFVINTTHDFKLDSGVGAEDFSPEQLITIDRRKILMKFAMNIKKGQSLTITKNSNYHTARDRENEGISLEKLKIKSLEELKNAGTFDRVLEQSAAAWQESVWNSKDIKIDSVNSFDQLALRFAAYHLTVMSPVHDNRMNIGAKGMSGEGYKGHTFWDTEIFMLPHFIWSDPKSARSLIEYRYNCIEGARRKAKEYNCEGAMYPWESAWVQDGEVTPLWGAADIVTGEATKIWTGIIELHIVSDVAYGVYYYYTTTGDEEFMDKYGYEIILDTAKFWQSRLEYNENLQRYEINGVIGPDEYKEHVNNNAFTNYMAHWNIKLAMEYTQKLKSSRPEIYERLNKILNLDQISQQWQEKVEKIYLPKPNENKLIPQDDTYLTLPEIDLTKYKTSDKVGTIYNDYNMQQIDHLQVSKQADVLVLFYLLESLFTDDIKRANFYYYEERCLHDSSLSLSTHSILASDVGEKDMAYNLFKRACEIDLGPVMTTSDAGIHAASFGGIWQCTVNGFAGVRVVGGKLRIQPHIPEAWNSLTLYIYWQGQRLELSISRSELTVKNLTDTKEVSFTCNGTVHTFRGQISLKIGG